nr:immunoglobulin light chain junction region [Macaca mulatta]
DYFCCSYTTSGTYIF